MSTEELKNLRNELDAIDDELTVLFEKRFGVIERIADVKAGSGVVINNPAREKEIYERVRERITNGSYSEYIINIFGSMLDESRSYQAERLENIILIGMPGCGKSEIGRRFAKKYGYYFIDCDELFTETCGITPEEYIRTKGESDFRKAETEVLAGLRPHGRRVIALGGGAVCIPDNFELVRPLGTIVYIRRPLERLASDGRPLSKEKGVEKLYDERHTTYELWADLCIDNDSDPDTAVDRIAGGLGH